jgi:phosphoenolpyruvate synthase/pyruvate phosphate dikinase
MESNTFVRWFEDLTSNDVEEVGGKNASLGEMIQSLKKKGCGYPMALPLPPMPTGSFCKMAI